MIIASIPTLIQIWGRGRRVDIPGASPGTEAKIRRKKKKNSCSGWSPQKEAPDSNKDRKTYKPRKEGAGQIRCFSRLRSKDYKCKLQNKPTFRMQLTKVLLTATSELILTNPQKTLFTQLCPDPPR